MTSDVRTTLSARLPQGPGWRKERGIFYWYHIGAVWSEDGERTWCWQYDDGEIDASGTGFPTPGRAGAVLQARYGEAVHTLDTRVRHAD